MLHQQERKGTCDGSFRDKRYFVCEEDYGAFLPANLILSHSSSASAHLAPTTTTRKKLLVSSANSKTDRDFYLDDQVVVFDTDGDRVPGVAKWAIPGKDYGVMGYLIGIETVRNGVAGNFQ